MFRKAPLLAIFASLSLSTASGAEPADNTTLPAAPISGQVQLVEVNLNVLRDLGLDIKRVRHGAIALNDEVCRQPVNLQTMPEVIGLGATVINVPIGFTGGGYLPPRASAISAAMDTIEPWVDIAKKDVDEILDGHKKLDLDDDTRQELQPFFKRWVAGVNETYEHVQRLKVLTKGPSFDNAAIAEQATAIEKESQQLEKVRRDIYKVLQREGKEAKKKK